MTFQRGVFAAVLAVIALALVLDRQEPDRASRTPAPAPPASLTAAEVQRIARRVERIRDLQFKRPVEPLFVSREAAIKMQQEATLEDSESSLSANQDALALLGLMKPGESLAKALEAVQREQVLGFYDDTRKRLVVVRERRASRALLEITLAHELVHALEDQHFGLRTRAVSDDGALAETTLAEGTATEVMADYAVKHLRVEDALDLFGAADTDTPLPKYVEDTLSFPYLRGLEFVETFRGRSGSWRALDNVIRFRRPRTVEQVIHADKYAIDERAAPPPAPDLGLALGPEWQRLDESSVSELDLRELFEIVGGASNRAAAAGWGGGRFELWRRGAAHGCRTPCVQRDVGVLLLSWDSPRDRREAERAFERVMEKGLRGRPLRSGDGGRQWSSRGGVIAVTGSGTRTGVVLAPDASLAALLVALAG
jgi:hypothetical protein